jgi:hypothetical protein
MPPCYPSARACAVVAAASLVRRYSQLDRTGGQITGRRQAVMWWGLEFPRRQAAAGMLVELGVRDADLPDTGIDLFIDFESGY